MSDSYRTPPWLFEYLDNQYDFEFDICASDENHLCGKYYTENNPYNGKNWREMGCIGFCNPPFSHGSKEKALSEAYRNLIENGVSSVFVIPSDVSNRFWLDHIIGKATDIKIVVGRVKFYDPTTNLESSGALGVSIVEFMLDEDPVFTVTEFIDRNEIIGNERTVTAKR